MRSLGYSYRFDRGIEAADSAAAGVSLGASSAPRLVSWASDPGAAVRVTDINGEVVADEPGGFDDFVLVPPGSDARFKVRGTNAALAVYELDRAAPGYTVDGITYRDRVGDDRRIAAAIAEPGESELSLGLDLGDAPLTVSHLCSGGGPGVTVHLEFADEGEVTTTGCEDQTFDPAGQGGYGFPDGVGTAGPTTLRMWVTTKAGEPVDADDLRLGVGVYADGEPAATFAGGSAVPEVVEHGGHTWQFTGLDESPVGHRELGRRVPAGTLVYFHAARLGTATLVPVVDGRPTGNRYATGAGSGVLAEPQMTASDVGVRVVGGRPPRARLGLATYERID
jgi:hypothetical protein